MKGYRYAAMIGGLLGLLVAGSPRNVKAQEAWERMKGNCEQVFKNFQQVKLPQLVYCMKIWEATRDVYHLPMETKKFMAGVFKRVYIEGSDEDSYYAGIAMARLGFPPTKEDEKLRRSHVERMKKVKKKRRKRYIPLPATKAQIRKAKRLRAKGMRYFRKKRYKEAIRYFEEALKLYGGYVQALYDEACARALIGDKEGAIEYLRRIRDLKTKEGFEKLRKARTDKDFASIRETPEFKEVTGYAHVKLLNGMPPEDRDIGDDNLVILKDLLAKVGYPPEEIGVDKHVRKRPIIWYKKPSKPVALVLKKLINHPHVLLVPIDWDTKWDIIISWADKVIVDKDGNRTVRFSMAKGGSFDPDKKAAEILAEEDKMLSAPDAYARKAEHVIDTPNRMLNKGKSAIDRVKSTGKTIERVIDKVKNPF